MFNLIRKWWLIILIKLRVRRIAAVALSESWPKVRIKAAGLPVPRAYEYVGRHSVAIVHKQVELFVRHHPTIDGSTANLLIVKASQRLNRQLLCKLAREPGARLRVA